MSCHPPFDCHPDVDPTILHLTAGCLRNLPEPGHLQQSFEPGTDLVL